MSADPRGVRVLHVLKGLGPGGAEHLVAAQVETSPPSVTFAVAYVLPWKDHLVGRVRAAGAPTHVLGGRRGLADPRWVLRARRLVATTRPDVVHLHSPAVAAVLRPVLRTLRPRPAVVSTEHNVWSSHGRITRALNAATQHLDDLTVAVTGEVAASAPNWWRRRMRTVVHGADVAALAARSGERARRREDLGVGDGEFLAVTVANLRATKDYPNLLAAAALVAEQAPEVRFVAVGQGPLAADLESAAAALGLGERFRFLGYREDPVAVVAAADAFVLASAHEGLPIALVEAMALGVPCVATAVGGVPAVLRDGADGVLVPPRDAAALAAAVLDLVRSPDRRRSLGAAAELRAADFDVRRAAEEWAALYRSVARR